EAFNRSVARAADSDDANARVGLIAQVQREAQTWGEYWPQVMRQLAPTSQPIVRAIAAGADPAAMTRLLGLPKGDDTPAKILRGDETKTSAVTASVHTEMKPFFDTLVGLQKQRDGDAYRNLVENLAAVYVRDGDDKDVAARKAFGAVVGN